MASIWKQARGLDRHSKMTKRYQGRGSLSKLRFGRAISLGTNARSLAVAIYLLTAYRFDANAQTFIGNKMFELCQSDSDFLSGYIAATVDKSSIDRNALNTFVSDAFADRKIDNPNIGKEIAALAAATAAIGFYCLPQGVTVQQSVGVFCKYLKDNPAERHKSAADLAVSALSAAFPCKLQ